MILQLVIMVLKEVQLNLFSFSFITSCVLSLHSGNLFDCWNMSNIPITRNMILLQTTKNLLHWLSLCLDEKVNKNIAHQVLDIGLDWKWYLLLKNYAILKQLNMGRQV